MGSRQRRIVKTQVSKEDPGQKIKIAFKPKLEKSTWQIKRSRGKKKDETETEGKQFFYKKSKRDNQHARPS